MKIYDILPLGTIITSTVVKPEIRNKTFLVITGRFFVQDEKKRTYFDYECNYYPGGTQDGTKLYMNHEYVDKVIFKGYSDDKDKEFLIKMKDILKKSGFKKSKYQEGIDKSEDKKKIH